MFYYITNAYFKLGLVAPSSGHLGHYPHSPKLQFITALDLFSSLLNALCDL